MPKLGHFTFDKKIIARGFTSVVYKGIDEITNQKVAIKCIDQAILDQPGKKKMLANQLSIQWQLRQQPYIVEIKGQFYQNDSIYIVSELCQSGDLKNKIKEKGNFVEAKAVSYMTDIIRGFQTLYRHNIVHRDLKPSNIMISKKGIKIGDFGFAYKVKYNQNAEEISLPSAGSPLYMAPQVLESGQNSSYQSDIWSLGVVFFEMLTGRLPFPAKNKQSLIKLIDKIVIRMIIPQNISPRSKQFLLRTLKKDVSKRMTPQQLINYQFDEQILYNIYLHKQRKRQQQIKRREEGDFSTSSGDRVSSQQKESCTNKNEQYNHTHLHHHHNPQVGKTTIHSSHQSNKNFEPEKPPVTRNINTVPQELISGKSMNKLREIVQHPQSNTTSKNLGFDNNQHKGKNFLDPHDISNNRFKRKQNQKNNNNVKEQSKTLQVGEITNLGSNTSIMYFKPVQSIQNDDSIKQEDILSKQLSKHSPEGSKRGNHHSNPREENMKPSGDNSHHHHSHDDHSRSPQEMKKQEIIEILLNQVDIIRFFSRIMHKIEEIHHIHHIGVSQKQQRSLSQNSNKQYHYQQTEHPLIYTQLKQLIYKTIQQIEKLQFLPDQVAYKFFRSEEFDQIKIILDTYKTKLNLSAVKSLQWKGSKLFEKELEKEILLIYTNINRKISKIESQHLENDSRQIKNVNRKIQALDNLIVFRYDYLILQREEIFLNDSNHKNAQHNEKCSRIKQIIQERNAKQFERNTLIQCCGELRKIEKVMKKIKLI